MVTGGSTLARGPPSILPAGPFVVPGPVWAAWAAAFVALLAPLAGAREIGLVLALAATAFLLVAATRGDATAVVGVLVAALAWSVLGAGLVLWGLAGGTLVDAHVSARRSFGSLALVLAGALTALVNALLASAASRARDVAAAGDAVCAGCLARRLASAHFCPACGATELSPA